MKYIFPIGDWSEDGHGQCDDIEVEGDLSIKYVREAHFKCKEVLGFEIGDICAEPDEYTIKPEIFKILKEKGLCKHIKNDFAYASADICDIWINILNYINTQLNLKRVIKNALPTITFYGFDEKSRHLQSPGYGIFYMG